ncbi:MAG TPA: hypothetical protein PK360_09565 [bacterium]|nr:hypothetical protein [bacterium]
MPRLLNLDDFERRANQALFQDGLTEIFLGLFLLLAGTLLRVHPLLVILSWLAAYGLARLFEPVKRRYIYPRMGFASVPAEKQTRFRDIVGVTALLLLFLVACIPAFRWFLGAESGWNFWSNRFLPAFFGGLLAIGPVSLAMKFGVKRWYGYGAAAVLSGLLVPFLGLESYLDILAVQILLLGAMFLPAGLALFTRFVRTHPAEGREIPDEEAHRGRE